MSEWWTYTLSDFLMFSPRVYFRLVERYNQDVWPLQLVFAGAMIAVVIVALRYPSRSRIALPAALAVAWAFCAWQFLLLRYAAINWAAAYAATAFFAQAALLAMLGLRDGPTAPAESRVMRYGGAILAAFGIVAYPLLAVLSGRALAAAEVFAVMPDPTSVTTLGVLLATWRQGYWLLVPIPLFWCVFSGLTLWTMDDAGAWVPALSAVLALALLLLGRIVAETAPSGAGRGEP